MLLENISSLFTKTLFTMGQTPVTLVGLGVATFIFLVSLSTSWFIQKLISKKLSRGFKHEPGLAYAIQRILHYLIVLIGLAVAAQSIGLDISSLAVVFGFLSVGIGFGLQNITSNFISGLILLFERPISVGDLVTIEQGDQSVVGVVRKVNMRSTLIQSYDNVAYIVPNSKFIENQVVNWSIGDPKVRLHVPVGVAYGSDTEKVKRVLLEAAGEHPDVLKDPAPAVWFTEFADSSLNFELLIWLEQLDRRAAIKSEVNFLIDKKFKDNNIQIPFPQRDIHLQLTPAIKELAGKIQ